MTGATFLNGYAILMWATYSGVVAATPAVTFPINSQVPPVARIGQPFSFVFSPSTFSSSSHMTYSLANAPAWLSIDGAKREITGVPTEDHVGPGSVVGVDMHVVATDDSGSTLSKTTLVVSRNQAPTLDVPLAAQSQSFGVFSSPSSILTHYGTPFSFSLGAATFTNPSGGSLNYYAATADNTPLPAWVSFDASTLTFSGKTPPLESLVEPPQAFDFKVLASDVIGFSAASLPFTLVVGVHEISPSSVTVKASPGSSLSYTGLRGTLKVDGQTTRPGDIKVSSTHNMPPWLSVHPATLAISGNVPESATSTDFQIVLQDQYSDSLNLTVSLDVTTKDGVVTGLFTGSLPQPTISTLGPFSIALGPYLTDSSDVDMISLTTSPLVDWLRLDEAGTKMVGNVPAAIPPGYLVKATIRATSKWSGKSQSQTMSLRIQLGANNSSMPTSTATSSTTSSPTGSLGQDQASPNITRTILMAALIPFFCVLTAVALLLCLLARRRKRQAHGRRPSDLSSQDISGPLPGSLIKIGPDGPYYGTHARHDTGQSAPLTSDTDQPCFLDRMFKKPRRVYLPLGSQTRKPSSKERMRSMSDNALDGVRYLRSSVVGAAVGVLQQPIKPAKKSKSRSYLSDSSIFEVYGGHRNNSPLGLLGNASRTSFRDAVEIGIPDIDACPSRGPRISDAGQAERWPEEQEQCQPELSPKPTPPLKNSPDTGMVCEDRASTPFFAPPSRLSRKVGLPANFLNTVKEKANMLSMLTINKFASKNNANYVKTENSEEEVSEVMRLPRPIPARLAAGDSRTPISRQCMHVSRWAATHNRGGARTVSASSEYPSIDEVPDVSEVDMRTPFPPKSSQSRDTLGIAYTDLIKDSPLNPSKSWSTLYSNEATGSGNARENVGAPSLRSLENWTVLKDAFNIHDWNTGATRDGQDFLSPSKWPKDGNAQALGTKNNWSKGASSSKRPLHEGPPKSSGSGGSEKENISSTGSVVKPSLGRGKGFVTPIRQEGSVSSMGTGGDFPVYI